jgi:diguanylate cyclase (GGDEF)-like protein
LLSSVPSRSALILIVDDEPLGARRVADMVAELGHRALVAQSWTDAIRLFSGNPIDLVLMDAVMPTVDGFKLTRILRDKARSYVPIVFVTGLTDRSARERGVEAGADDLLMKPVDPVELRVRLTAMLRIRHLTQDLETKTRTLALLASTDSLTGLHNRRSLDERLPIELERANRYDRPVSLLMLDIDRFKRVNDAYGHEVGDEVLSFAGDLVRDVTRAADLSFRYGGEEFVVIAPETTSAHAGELGERLRAAFAARSGAACRAGVQTISVGACATHQLMPPVDVVTMFRAVDAALYRAKQSGRDRVVIWDPEKMRLAETVPQPG